jgi:hypothetical protein
MEPPNQTTPPDEGEARRPPTKSGGTGRVISEAEKATRKDRVGRAKDALARSVGAKGEHVVRARADLKAYLQRLNEPKQPDDERFEELVKAPFKAPPKKKSNDRRF